MAITHGSRDLCPGIIILSVNVSVESASGVSHYEGILWNRVFVQFNSWLTGQEQRMPGLSAAG